MEGKTPENALIGSESVVLTRGRVEVEPDVVVETKDPEASEETLTSKLPWAALTLAETLAVMSG